MNLWNQRSCIFHFSVNIFYIPFLYQYHLVARSAHLAIFSFQFPSPSLPLFLYTSFYQFLTQANVITQFPLLYAIMYFVLCTQPETWDSNQNVKLIIIISSSFSTLTLMGMVSICKITVISFLTSSLRGNQFTKEGEAQLRKAREERDPDFVKLEEFLI